jgi:peptide/nickel transport system permease protein
MTRFIIRRILTLIPVFLGINFLIFTIMYLSPGDAAATMLGPGATEEQIAQLRAKLGHDQPFFIQYMNNLKSLVTLNYGRSYSTGRPVLDDFSGRFPVTLTLALGSTLFALLVGLPLGVMSAVKQYSIFDYVGVVVSLVLSAIPSFWFGIMLIILFAIKIPLVPVSGIDSFASYILPIFSMGTVNSVILMRMTRSIMLEVIRQDYIRTIRAKGAPERYVIFKHALKNALLPIITTIGARFGHMLGGVVVIETVFAIPGVGTMLVDGVRMKDLPTVMIGVTLFSFAFCFVNLLVDLLYAAVDPRIRESFSR